MIPVRVGCGVVNQVPLDWHGNLARLRACVADARAAGVSLLCLPELAVTGYGCEDAFHAADTLERAWASVETLAGDTAGMAVTVGLPVRHRGATYNVAAMLVDGRILGLVAKQHLAGDGIHYEPRWFKPWPSGKQAWADRPGVRVPLGDLYFELGGVRIGFEICEDAWVATRPGAALAGRALDVVCNPSASHFAFGKLAVRRRLIQEGSRAFGVTYLYANLLGNEAGRVIFDGGAQIATAGEIVASSQRFGFAEHEVVHTVIDVEHTRLLQARTASFRPGVEDGGDACVRAVFPWPRAPWAGAQHPAPPREREDKREEFTAAVTLALFDYLRKSGARGYLVSLSGGADSTACAVLVHLAHRRARAALGDAEVARRLHLTPVPEGDEAWSAALLTCVYQATAQSGAVTRHAAEGVAAALGARFHTFDVEPLVRAYRALAEGAVGRRLTWEDDDIALQNVQARARAPGVWMLANLTGALLLTTSNRSESALGYATMDGDTAGGLAPLGGIDKSFLRAWLRWMEVEGPADLGPLPALALVTAQVPTAELRPADAGGQTDEDDLMPYAVLNTIERAAIRDKRAPAECLDVLQAEHPAVPRSQLVAWVRRFFTLWCRNQWKRERYAPSFHLDDESLDPRTWCRFPILSGGYAAELAELG